jgi:hypothetical protein
MTELEDLMFVIPRVRPVNHALSGRNVRSDAKWPNVVCVSVWLCVSVLGWAGIMSAYALITS